MITREQAEYRGNIKDMLRELHKGCVDTGENPHPEKDYFSMEDKATSVAIGTSILAIFPSISDRLYRLLFNIS